MDRQEIKLDDCERALKSLWDDFWNLRERWGQRKLSWQDVLEEGLILWGRQKYLLRQISRLRENVATTDEKFKSVNQEATNLLVHLSWCLDPATSFEKIPEIPIFSQGT